MHALEPSDGDAVAQRAAAGDRQALNELIGRCHSRLEARVRWLLGEGARRDAETADFAQCVWAKILADAGKLSWTSEGHFLNLATRIARNEIVNRVKRPRVQRFASFCTTVVADAAGTAVSPATQAGEEELSGRLLDALSALPPDDQQVIEMREFQGLPFEEIAVRLGRSPNAAQLLHSRAVARLGRALAS